MCTCYNTIDKERECVHTHTHIVTFIDACLAVLWRTRTKTLAQVLECIVSLAANGVSLKSPLDRGTIVGNANLADHQLYDDWISADAEQDRALRQITKRESYDDEWHQVRGVHHSKWTWCRQVGHWRPL
jgi:hypothetical protein